MKKFKNGVNLMVWTYTAVLCVKGLAFLVIDIVKYFDRKTSKR